MTVWRRYWWSLVLVHLVSYSIPWLVAVLVGAVLGLFPDGVLEALRVVLLDQTAGGRPYWEEVSTAPAGLLAILIFLLLTLVASAGKLGVPRAIVHGGCRPGFPDFVSGIRLFSVRLLVVKPCGACVTSLVALLVMVVARVILADWLPIVALAVMLAGLSSATTWKLLNGRDEMREMIDHAHQQAASSLTRREGGRRARRGAGVAEVRLRCISEGSVLPC